MWRERERCGRGPAKRSASSARALRKSATGLGPFLAAQIVADLKHVAPLDAATDWWTLARPGPGSERGLNRVRGRP